MGDSSLESQVELTVVSLQLVHTLNPSFLPNY